VSEARSGVEVILLAESALELLERSAWRSRMILVVSKSFCVYRGHVEHILSCWYGRARRCPGRPSVSVASTGTASSDRLRSILRVIKLDMRQTLPRKRTFNDD
jgi:hypothetical protein